MTISAYVLRSEYKVVVGGRHLIRHAHDEAEVGSNDVKLRGIEVKKTYDSEI